MGAVWAGSGGTRRVFLSACGCAAMSAYASARQPRRPGCFASNGAIPEEFAEGLREANFNAGTTGALEWDRPLGIALAKMAAFFKVYPSVGMFDDQSQPQALAYETSIRGTTDGTVVLGRHFLNRLMSDYADSGVAVVGILAHEFAHIFQYRHDLVDRLIRDDTVKLAELHADFLAGMYLARLRREQPGLQLYYTGEQFSKMGDAHSDDPDHHGTPAERLRSIEFGFKAGTLRPTLTPEEAIEESIRYIIETFGR